MNECCFAVVEEEVTKKEREERALAKAKKRALSTAMMRELRSEYSETPEEFRDDLNVHRLKQSKQDQHRVDYEEDNFKRLALTKEDKVTYYITFVEFTVHYIIM